jgi:hypothetical protein
MIGGTIKVYSGYPWISLRAAGLHSLPAEAFGVSTHSPKWQYLDEAYVTLRLKKPGSTHHTESKRLEAIYFLDPVADPNFRPVAEPVSQHEALMGLMEAARCTHIPYPEFRAQEFSLMGSVAATIPAYQLRYHMSVPYLPMLRDLLLRRSGLGSRRREEIEAW